jgi:nucleoside-diphosphate-sugar epimerase
MKIFVTGSTGVAGRAIVPALVKEGHDVTAVVRSDAKADLVRQWGAAPVEVDLFDPVAVRRAVVGYGAVCNFATHIPSLTRAARPGAWRQNDRLRREVSANLSEAVSDSDCTHFVQESIGFVYPDSGDAWIDEQVPPAPTPVVSSVLEAEANVSRVASPGRSGVILRLGQFYGPKSTHSRQSLQLAARFGIGPFPGDPNGYSSWMHTDDLGAAVAAALSAPTGIYNVCDDEPLRRHELHALVAVALGRQSLREVGKFAARIGGRRIEAIARSQRLSHGAFTTATGWTPTVTSTRQGWPALVNEWRNHG